MAGAGQGSGYGQGEELPSKGHPVLTNLVPFKSQRNKGWDNQLPTANGPAGELGVKGRDLQLKKVAWSCRSGRGGREESTPPVERAGSHAKGVVWTQRTYGLCTALGKTSPSISIPPPFSH